jgi:hypothetical protein
MTNTDKIYPNECPCTCEQRISQYIKLLLRHLLTKLHKPYHPENNVLPKTKIFSWENQHSKYNLLTTAINPEK